MGDELTVARMRGEWNRGFEWLAFRAVFTD
jgi:hypothetical protein